MTEKKVEGNKVPFFDNLVENFKVIDEEDERWQQSVKKFIRNINTVTPDTDLTQLFSYKPTKLKQVPTSPTLIKYLKLGQG